MRVLIRSITFCCSFWSALTYAATPQEDLAKFQHPFYMGVAGGYGSTTWQGLVPVAAKQNTALSISVPTWVTEGGGAWGGFIGYEITPYFAIEGHYTHYPQAQVFFDVDSLFAFENEGQTKLVSNTNTGSINAKFMVLIPSTFFRAYSSIGAAWVQRNDDIKQGACVAPTFGVGMNYMFTPHFMAEIGGQYTSGYGESELSPADDFIPFLYAVVARVAYRF